MAEARQYLELRGELTGELPNVADASANVTLVRVLTVPRLPGVVDPVLSASKALRAGAPAAERMEAVRSLPAGESRLVDAPVESEPSGLAARNRR